MVINALATKIHSTGTGTGKDGCQRDPLRQEIRFPLQAFTRRSTLGSTSRRTTSPHLFGDTFPPCLDCSDSVRFELALSAVYFKAHPQFKRFTNPEAIARPLVSKILKAPEQTFRCT